MLALNSPKYLEESTPVSSKHQTQRTSGGKKEQEGRYTRQPWSCSSKRETEEEIDVERSDDPLPARSATLTVKGRVFHV